MFLPTKDIFLFDEKEAKVYFALLLVQNLTSINQNVSYFVFFTELLFVVEKSPRARYTQPQKIPLWEFPL